jgi:hypothetical protein
MAKTITRRQIKKLACELYQEKVDIWQGYHVDKGRRGWIMQRFGRGEVFLGETLLEAYDTLLIWHELKTEG